MANAGIAVGNVRAIGALLVATDDMYVNMTRAIRGNDGTAMTMTVAKPRIGMWNMLCMTLQTTSRKVALSWVVPWPDLVSADTIEDVRRELIILFYYFLFFREVT